MIRSGRAPPNPKPAPPDRLLLVLSMPQLSASVTESARKFYGTSCSELQALALRRTFVTWTGMLGRCFIPGVIGNENYTRRQITVCERWFLFSNFVKDMGMRPDGLTLDRIDNDKGYEPGNCRWATATEQARNTSRNKRVGTGLQVDAARAAGVHEATILRRLRSGYSDAEAVQNDGIKKNKLNAHQVREIRAMLDAGVARKDVQALFDVSHTTVGDILRRKSWATA